MDQTYKKINRVLIFILLLNFIVCGAKIIFGYISKSASMTADGLHSLSDGTSNIAGIIGIWLSSRPTDEGHPYGHKKFETYTTIIIAILLFIVCYEVMINAIERFTNPGVHPTVGIGSFIVMISTLIINLWVSWYETRRGKEFKSDFLISDALHTKSDIYVSISVIISLIVVKLGLPIMDIITSIVIAVIIAKAGIEIVIHSANILCDAAPIQADKIKDIVSSIDEIKVCHKIRTRGREDDVHVDLHVGVDKSMNIEDGHNLCHAVENTIKQKILGVSEVIVHIEPYR